MRQEQHARYVPQQNCTLALFRLYCFCKSMAKVCQCFWLRASKKLKEAKAGSCPPEAATGGNIVVPDGAWPRRPSGTKRGPAKGPSAMPSAFRWSCSGREPLPATARKCNFFLPLVRHLLLEAMHLFLLAYCF